MKNYSVNVVTLMKDNDVTQYTCGFFMLFLMFEI